MTEDDQRKLLASHETLLRELRGVVGVLERIVPMPTTKLSELPVISPWSKDELSRFLSRALTVICRAEEAR